MKTGLILLAFNKSKQNIHNARFGAGSCQEAVHVHAITWPGLYLWLYSVLFLPSYLSKFSCLCHVFKIPWDLWDDKYILAFTGQRLVLVLYATVSFLMLIAEIDNFGIKHLYLHALISFTISEQSALCLKIINKNNTQKVTRFTNNSLDYHNWYSKY